MEPKLLDVLIIGAGGAGCSAAMEAFKITPNILVLTKDSVFESKTAWAQGGMQAAFGIDDSPELHFEDTMKAGNHKSNPELVKILSENAVEVIDWLSEIGVPFDRDEKGNYVLKTAGGLCRKRVLSAGDDSGNNIIKPVINRLRELKIPYQEHTAVLDINFNPNFFEVLISSNSIKSTLQTKTIVLATGGTIPGEKRAGTTLTNNKTPDGNNLLLKIGAKVVQPNLTQYHPTGVIIPKGLRRKRLPETLRSAGATILNKNLEQFVNPLLTRSEVVSAIVKECKEGRGISTDDGYVGVWLNTPEVDKKNGKGYIKKHFSKFYKLFLDYNIDLTQEKVLIYPIVHYSLGGVEIDSSAQTSINGIFAAGEATYGVHGEDRLMGNSLTDIFVFGRIAGKNAALYSKK